MGYTLVHLFQRNTLFHCNLQETKVADLEEFGGFPVAQQMELENPENAK